MLKKRTVPGSPQQPEAERRGMASGENLEELEFSKALRVDGAHYFRYVTALPVQPVYRRRCHGAPEHIPEIIEAGLAGQPQGIAATGYRVQQGLGAVPIRQSFRVEN